MWGRGDFSLCRGGDWQVQARARCLARPDRKKNSTTLSKCRSVNRLVCRGFVPGDALQPVATATTLAIRGGKTETVDGPFAETKEQLGGYYLLDCVDLDEALKYAAMIPTAEHGRIEVRPIIVFDA